LSFLCVFYCNLPPAACNLLKLSLALLKAWILLVDHVQPSLSPHDLAIHAALLNCCSYFHDYRFSELFIPKNDPSPGQVVQAHLHSHFITRKDPDVIHPHLSGDRCQYFVPVFQLDFEHSIAQCFYDNSILFDQRLFSHTFWVRKDNKIKFPSKMSG
jgi:hypothetical protein